MIYLLWCRPCNSAFCIPRRTKPDEGQRWATDAYIQRGKIRNGFSQGVTPADDKLPRITLLLCTFRAPFGGAQLVATLPATFHPGHVAAGENITVHIPFRGRRCPKGCSSPRGTWWIFARGGLQRASPRRISPPRVSSLFFSFHAQLGLILF